MTDEETQPMDYYFILPSVPPSHAVSTEHAGGGGGEKFIINWANSGQIIPFGVMIAFRSLAASHEGGVELKEAYSTVKHRRMTAKHAILGKPVAALMMHVIRVRTAFAAPEASSVVIFTSPLSRSSVHKSIICWEVS